MIRLLTELFGVDSRRVDQTIDGRTGLDIETNLSESETFSYTLPRSDTRRTLVVQNDIDAASDALMNVTVNNDSVEPPRGYFVPYNGGSLVVTLRPEDDEVVFENDVGDLGRLRFVVIG